MKLIRNLAQNASMRRLAPRGLAASLGFVLSISLLSTAAHARAASGKSQPENADVGAIKEKYWARGDENELGVVQNRLYSKAHKFELGVFGGLTSNDPFLNIKQVGGRVGFHLSELWSVHAIGWKNFVKGSSALEELHRRSLETNTNEPTSYFGGEFEFSPIYGKLSLLGSAIIYYDFHITAGAGRTETETGGTFTPMIGLGQQIWMNSWMALNIDWRLMTFQEDIKDKISVTTPGAIVDNRRNWTNTLNIGLTFLLGG